MSVLFGMCCGGLLSLHMIHVCDECDRAAARSYRCTMRVFEPVALVVDCPVDTLFAGQSLFVMEVAGEVGEALLMPTSLGCGDSLNVRVLNGRPCMTTVSTTTTNQTTVGRWPWPFPGIPVDDEVPNGTRTETTATTETTSPTTTGRTTTRTTTTHTIAITTGWQLNGTTIILTVAVLISGVGVFVTVRLVIRRRRRRSADIRTPVEIEELSSLSTMVVDTPATPVSPRRRRKPGSMESVELFSVTK